MKIDRLSQSSNSQSGFLLGYYVIGDRWSDELERVLFESCGRIQTLCRNFLDDTKDSSVINPAFLELVRLKRSKPNEKIGLIFKPSMDGIHTVSGIRENSPASRCNKLSIMDEIVQIDYTCVTNWTLENILNKFKQANPAEVCLTLRKRPRNMTLHYHLRRMKVMTPPAHEQQVKKEQNSTRRNRKSTVDSSKTHPVVTAVAPASGAVSPKKPVADPPNSRQSFLAPDARKPSETLGVNALRLGSRKDSLRRRSLSANSVQHVEDIKSFVNKTSTPNQPPAIRDEVLQSVSSNDPSTSSGALSSDQDSSVFQTPSVPPQQEIQERHSVIDRRVSIKDLGETEISGNLQRKRGNEWIPCHCVIKNALFYVFASSAAEKADLVIGLKSVDVEIAEKQDNFKFVFKMQTTNQQKQFLFAAGDRTDLGHWVNNLHTAKVLLRNKKISTATRQLLVSEIEIDEADGESEKTGGKRHHSSENFSETDEEDAGDTETAMNGANAECNELEKSLRLLRSSFLGGASAGASPFSRSSTIDEGSNRLETRSISATKLSGSYVNFSDKLESNLEASSQEKDKRLNQSTEAVPVKAASFDSNNSGDKEPCSESYMMESSQSMKLVLAPDAIEERLEKVWEEPATELDRLQSKKRALERKLQAKLVELTKVEELITTGKRLYIYSLRTELLK